MKDDGSLTTQTHSIGIYNISTLFLVHFKPHPLVWECWPRPFTPALTLLDEWKRLEGLLMYFIDVYFLLMYIWPIFYTNINLIDVYTPIAFPEERYPLYRTRNIYLYIYLLFIDVYLYILMYI